MMHNAVRLTVEGLRFILLFHPNLRQVDSQHEIYPHKHSLYEMHYIFSGAGHLYHDSGSTRVEPGMCFLIAPGAMHLFQADPDSTIERFDLPFSYEQPQSEKKNSEILRSLNGFSVCHWRAQQELLPVCIALLEAELDSKGPAFNSAITALLTLVIINILRNVSQADRSGTGHANNSTADDVSIRSFNVIDAFYFENYASGVTRDMLARRLAVSPRQLNRILQRHYGMSFQEKLIQVRMDVAKNLLRQSGLSITQIARQTGYEYLSSFCNQFYKTTGMWPEQYRRTH
jgi:AraC family 4-hydroxyphenylacetate 3-monooxygenase operon regulatory protein